MKFSTLLALSALVLPAACGIPNSHRRRSARAKQRLHDHDKHHDAHVPAHHPATTPIPITTVAPERSGPTMAGFAADPAINAAGIYAAAQGSRTKILASYPTTPERKAYSSIYGDWWNLTGGVSAFHFIADMDVDCDGPKGNRDGQSETSFGALDATKVPYFVLPERFTKDYKNMLMDNALGAIICNDKMFYGIYGDQDADSPQVIGEASILIAQTCFGTSVDGNNGHPGADVAYIVFGTKVPNGIQKTNIDISALKSLGDSQIPCNEFWTKHAQRAGVSFMTVWAATAAHTAYMAMICAAETQGCDFIEKIFMSSSPASQATSSGVNFTRDADLLIRTFLPTSESLLLSQAPAYDSPLPALPLPYCAPQLASGFDTPFSRGYNPALERLDISQEQLLAFIDGLNLAMTASPPLRVVSLAGMVVGFVPYHWAMLAGAAIQTSAEVGMRVLSKTLTDRYLRAANKRLFKPRGLSVRICTSAAMQRLVLPPDALAVHSGEAITKLDRVGRKVGSVLMKVPLPMANLLVHAVAKKPPRVAAMDVNSRPSKKLLATQRRVAALDGYILPLNFAVPKATKAEGVMDTMASWGVKFDAWREGRKQTKAEDSRVELEAMENGQQWPSNDFRRGSGGGGLLLGRGGLIGGVINLAETRLRGGERSPSNTNDRPAARRTNSNLAGLLAQRVLGPRGNNSSLDPEMRRLRMQVSNADLQEYWESSKLLWVVIMSSDLDAEIDGIERAESAEDEEQVDEDAWRAEMAVERQERELDGEIERASHLDV
ncbi:fungal chitosanase of glycosyl hydrolase group 75-domain-containing protein [Mycena amicta]|nr:fungal chitosanase of glycosyl hydrolase group 75-domain-containing protein [Mycena amicta]